MRKKQKRTMEMALPPEHRAGFERSQRVLAERIAFYEARIAARESGEDPDAVAA